MGTAHRLGGAGGSGVGACVVGIGNGAGVGLCIVAVAADTLTAYKLAYATDTTSAFGGIIAFNCEVDGETVK